MLNIALRKQGLIHPHIWIGTQLIVLKCARSYLVSLMFLLVIPEAEHLDIFPAPQPEAPIMVFIHGGYWMMASSKEFSFVAKGMVSAGITTVVVNYELCPKVTIDEIVRQTRAAIAWVYQNAKSFGADPNRIYVSGHSAGVS